MTIRGKDIQLRVDLGHLLTIGVFLVSIGIAWGSIDAVKVRQMDMIDVMKQQGNTITAIRDQQITMDGRMKRVEEWVDEQRGKKR